MKLKITTENSTYVVDTVAHTWERTQSGPDSGHLRTTSGTFHVLELPVVGRPLTMLCPPLTPGATARFIATSLITQVQENA